MTQNGPVSRSSHGGSSSFFASRLRAPANPAHYLRRPRLISLLAQCTSVPITVVVAPAGSGKTSLLVDWRSLAPVPTAWLSVDESDRDGGQFWSAVTAALGELVDLGKESSSTRRPVTRPDVVPGIVARLERSDHPASAVLVLDDIHLVDDDDVLVDSLAHFLTALPDWLHVVLLTRRTPKLPVDRLRVRGQLVEVHFAELRFSPEESEEMLVCLQASLGHDEVSAAVDRAGGWAAGLQLTALASRSDSAQPVSLPRVDAKGLLFADYVWREVLAAERQDVVDVLLDTSVVVRMNAALATALSGRPDAGDLLADAEARGLFITRLGPSGWFEVHAVVRQELVAEVARRTPERVAALHARAARWFEDVGEVTSALEHWIFSGRPREALRLLAGKVSELYDSGRTATIERTIAQIPLNVASGDLDAMIEFAWCHLLVDKRRFLEAVDAATASRARLAVGGRPQDGRLMMLQSIAATLTGDWRSSSTLATQAIALLADDSQVDLVGRFGWNMIAREVALSERWDDGSALVHDVRQELGWDPERRLGFEGTRAVGEALAGRPVDALRVAAGIRGVDVVASMAILCAELSLAEAVAHRELGDRARAVTELVSVAPRWLEPVAHAEALAMLQLTELRLDEGDLEAAEACFERAHAFVRSEFAGPGGLLWLARTGTLVALAADRPAEARRWAEQVDDPFWGGVSVARVDLHDGRRAEAAALLDQVRPRCPRHDVVRDLLRARAAENHQAALDHVARAVERATRVGLVQTVASEGSDVLELVEVHAFLAPAAWLDRVRRAASPLSTARTADPSVPGEHLTERELDVLRMLPSRLTLREIADELSISVNTLKFHLKVVYRKLAVGSRAEAADLARDIAERARSGVGASRG